tara:strand:+ start:1406 stop:1771 length:366 start_codon:yes stop_codon:yes gene_type:complete
MEPIEIFLQVGAALTVINVWTLRLNKSTPWRGGNATNMREEFEEYGLPRWTLVTVGSAKLLFALLLVVGIGIQEVTPFAAAGMSTLLLGALVAHIKIRDPLKKSMPAASMLAALVVVLVLQ